MKEWTLTTKKKMLTTLACLIAAGVLGYLETLIPPLFASLPFLRVELGVLFALFVLFAYSPLEAIIVYGVRSIVFGLVLDDGFAILWSLLSASAAMVAGWAMLRTRKFSPLFIGAGIGLIYAFVYTAFACISAARATPFALLDKTMAFYTVDYLVMGALAAVALRYIPERWIIDRQK